MKKAIRKIISVCLCVGVIGISIPQQAQAYQTPKTIAIGLKSVCQGATSATLDGTELLVGTLNNENFTEDGRITSHGSFTIQGLQSDIVAIKEHMRQQEAEDLANSLSRLHFDACLGYLGNDTWTVYVQNTAVSAVEQALPVSAERIAGFEGIVVQGGSTPVLTVGKDIPYGFAGTGAGHTFSINGKAYRGYLSFSQVGRSLTAVNTVDLDAYLYGVVPSEMPASYHPEALKTQTLAARSYAMTKRGVHEKNGYALCDTIHCQVYKGYGAENPTVNALIDATEGEVICYQGKPIEAVFSASSGGYTENSEDVWNAPVPYLRAVPEISEYGDNTWSKTLTLAQLNQLLSAKGEQIGNAKDMVITKVSAGGRVQELQIIGTSGVKTLTKENIRTYFSSACGTLPSKMFTINGKGGAQDSGAEPVTVPNRPNENTSAAKGSLSEAAMKNGITAVTEGTLSQMNGKTYQIADLDIGYTKENSTKKANQSPQTTTTNISTVQNGTFVFSGKGNGHGVGMSQNGAQAMALKGYNYQEIIKHYYSDVTIEG